MKSKAFTLIEVLLTVAVIAIIGATSIPIYISFLNRNDLDVAVNTVVQTARRAEILAQGSDGDQNWGLSVQTGTITLFKGTNFAARDQNYDETFTLPEHITPSGLQEIVFAKLTGYPQSTGTLTLTSTINETRDVSINTKGILIY